MQRLYETMIWSFVIVTWLYGTKEDHIKQSRLTRCSTTLKQKRFQNFFNSISLILNSKPKEGSSGVISENILCNQLIWNVSLIKSFLF